MRKFFNFVDPGVRFPLSILFVLLLMLVLGGCQATKTTTVQTDQPTVTSPATPEPAPTAVVTAPAKSNYTIAQVKSVLNYMDTSLQAIDAGLKIIQTQLPDMYPATIAKVQPIITEAQMWVSKAKNAYDEDDLDKAVSFYNLARPQLGNALDAIQEVCGSVVKNWLFGSKA